jgi:hypothetical protein
MSSPHVAGAIALLLQAFPDLSAEDSKEILMMSAAPIPNGSSYGDPANPLSDDEMKEWGAGKLNILEAYRYMVGFIYGGGFLYVDMFKDAYTLNSEAGIPIGVVMPDWNGFGSEFYVQEFTNGAITYHEDQREANWLGCCIWETYTEGETGGQQNHILLGFPVSSQYQHEEEADVVVADFEKGRIYCDTQSGIARVVLFRYADIKPGSCPNPLNVKPYRTEDLAVSNSFAKLVTDIDRKPKPVIPAAILGTEDLDVSEIDATTLMLEGVPVWRWSMEDVGTPIGPDAEICECNELGGDGYTDLTLKFDKQAVIDELGEVNDGDEIALTITGQLYNGIEIEGIDCVVIRAKRELEEIFTRSTEVPEVFALKQNYPNPFNPETEIDYSIPEACFVTLNIYNLAGQKVVALIDRYQDAGMYSVRWDGRDSDGKMMSSGIYFYRLSAGDFIESRKMILMK